MAAPVASGDVIAGKYRVDRVLGAGGMGVVVAAFHLQLEQRVALKFLLAEALDNDEIVGRFLREARSAVRLRSEHVARVLDVGQTEAGAPYIVMEYLDGSDLAHVLDREERLSVGIAVAHVLQACEAVAEAHALGIVHRDLKPANLFLVRNNDGSPCIKVLDFGISKAVGPAVDDLTKTSRMLGTPSYMSPEQMRSAKTVDVRSDIWALGMILYELLTGRVAFEQQTLPELCAAVLTDETPRPRGYVPSIPEGLEAIVLRALAKLPAERFQNVGEFAAALSPFAPEGDAGASRISRILGRGSSPLLGDDTLPQNTPTPRLPPPAPDVARTQAQADTSRTLADATARSIDEPEPEAPARRAFVLPLVLGLAVLALVAFFVGRRALTSPSSAATSNDPSPPIASTSAPSPSAAAASAATISPQPRPEPDVAPTSTASAPSPPSERKAPPKKVAPKPREDDFGGRQ